MSPDLWRLARENVDLVPRLFHWVKFKLTVCDEGSSDIPSVGILDFSHPHRDRSVLKHSVDSGRMM